MTFLQIKYFVKVCECGSVTKAAKQLHVSQPSVSYAIRELEEEYETELFQRSENKMIPTKRGIFLWKSAEGLLTEWDRMEMKMKEYCSSEVQMGMSPIIGKIFGQQLLSEFQKENPEVHVTVTETNSVEAVEMVQNGELDTALIFRPEKTDEKDMRIDIVGDLEGSAAKEKIYLQICLLSKKSRKISRGQKKMMEFANNRQGMKQL